MTDTSLTQISPTPGERRETCLQSQTPMVEPGSLLFSQA